MTFVQHIQHGYDTQNEISVVEHTLDCFNVELGKQAIAVEL